MFEFSILEANLLLLASFGEDPHSMLLVLFPLSLVPASVLVEVDALAFFYTVSELAYINTSVVLRSVFPEVNAESVLLVVTPLAVVAVSICILQPAKALLHTI